MFPIIDTAATGGHGWPGHLARLRMRAYPAFVPQGLSPTHLLVIFVVALVVLGPDKLPDAARQVGKLVAQARSLSAGLTAQMESALSVEDRSSATSAVAVPGSSDLSQSPTMATEELPPRPAPDAPPAGKEQS